jgi:hypothetical protein
MAAAPDQSSSIPDQEPSANQPDDGLGADEEERARVRIRAAMNIFDAEEIRQPEATSRPVSSPDV